MTTGLGKGDEVDFTLKKMMEAVGPSAALAFASWRLLQLLEQRHDAAYTRYRELVQAFREGAAGKRLDLSEDEIGICRKRLMHMLDATNIGMMAAFLLLLSLTISTLDAVFKADWLKLFGAPSNMLRLLLVIPAALLVLMDNMLTKKRLEAERGGPAQHIPERRARERCGNTFLQPHGA